MSFDGRQLVRVAKRLLQASGYLELGMRQHALDRLDGLGDLGPFEAAVELLRAEALRGQHRYQDAATSFKNAARKFPSPQNKPVWLASSLCYRQAGDILRAIQSLARARGARPRTTRRRPQ